MYGHATFQLMCTTFEIYYFDVLVLNSNHFWTDHSGIEEGTLTSGNSPLQASMISIFANSKK